MCLNISLHILVRVDMIASCSCCRFLSPSCAHLSFPKCVPLNLDAVTVQCTEVIVTVEQAQNGVTWDLGFKMWVNCRDGVMHVVSKYTEGNRGTEMTLSY